MAKNGYLDLATSGYFFMATDRPKMPTCVPGCGPTRSNITATASRAWTAVRHDDHRQVNKKKLHWRWKDEGLQRRLHSPASVLVSRRGRRRVASHGVV